MLWLSCCQKLFDTPSVICKSCRLRWCLAVCAVDAAEVEMRDKQGHCMAMVFVFLGVTQCQARKPAVEKPNAQVCPFRVAGVDSLANRVADSCFAIYADKRLRCIPA